MRRMPNRRPFRRASVKRKVFWYAPQDCYQGGIVAANFSAPLVVIPKDVAGTSLLSTAGEAPHMDEVRVERIRGQIVLANNSGALEKLSVGICVFDLGITTDQEGGAIAQTTIGLAPVLDINKEMARSWLFIAHRTVANGNANFSHLEVDVKVKRILRQGQGLFLKVETLGAGSVGIFLRTLLSKNA